MTPTFAHQLDLADKCNPEGRQLISRRSILGAAAAGAIVPVFPGTAHTAQRAPEGVQGDAIIPFRISVPQEEIDGLRARLRLTRWPETETIRDWSQGVPLVKAKALIDAWSSHDRRAFERRVNLLP